MKKTIFITTACLFALIVFVACPKDKISPRAQLLGFDGKPFKGVSEIKNKPDNVTLSDTVILLSSKYEDPGIRFEDNKSVIEKIKVTNDLDKIPGYSDPKKPFYVTTTGVYTITYTITDEDNNNSTLKRIIRVANPAEVLCPYKEYGNTTSTTFTLVERTTQGPNRPIPKSANINFSTDTKIPGAVKLNKAYWYVDNNSQEVSIPLTAHLFADKPSLSSVYSKEAGYLGKPNDATKPFYDDYKIHYNKKDKDKDGNEILIDALRPITFKETVDLLSKLGSGYRIGYLKIETKVDVQGTDGKKYDITEDPQNTKCPIEYIGKDQAGQEVIKITLYYSITEKGTTNQIKLKEVYEKRYTDDE